MFERASTQVRRERVAVDPQRRTPREDAAAGLRRMVEALDAMTPAEREALIADDSVDEAGE